MSSLTAHLNRTHFPEPEVFLPTRWMSENSETVLKPDGEGGGGTEAMKKLFMPWTRGMYKCIGQGMAMQNLRLTIAALVLKYDVKLAKDATLAR